MAEGSTEKPINSSQEIPTEVEWVEIKNLFQPNTIGHFSLNSFLLPSDTTRKRPKTILDEPIQWLWRTDEDHVRTTSNVGYNSHVLEKLKTEGITTVKDLLSLSSLERFEDKGLLNKLIERYFREDLRTLPHMRLLQKVFGHKEPPILTPDNEDFIIEKTNKALEESGITLEWIKVLEQRFGLKDGIRRTTKEVAKTKGVTVQDIRKIQDKSFPRLYYTQAIKEIEDFINNQS